jgi:hypothetical protein
MQTIGIREVSGPRVSEAARRHEPLGITFNHMLAGVLFPVTSTWHSDAGSPSPVQAFASPENPAVPPPARQIPIRDFSAKRLREAAKRREVLGLTYGKVLTGVICPVTPEWITQLIEQNISTILKDIKQGEREIESGAPLTTLDDLVPEK